MILTIYTPTYNRASNLKQLYKSLCEQSNMNFIWLVVDDGSTDDTSKIVDSWKKEKKINIEYAYKKNGGVHTARDLAYKKVHTELVVGIDSDDWLVNDFVETILEVWNKEGSNNYCGIITPVQDMNGNVVGYKFPNDKFASFQDLTYKLKCVGDHNIVSKSEIIKSIPDSPIYENEKLVGENYKWVQLPNIPFILVNKCLVYHSYLEDWYTQNARKSWFKNLNGFRAEYKKEVECIKYFIPRQKANIQYSIASLFLKDKEFIRNSPAVFSTAVLYPVSFLVYCILKVKWNKYMQMKDNIGE